MQPDALRDKEGNEGHQLYSYEHHFTEALLDCLLHWGSSFFFSVLLWNLLKRRYSIILNEAVSVDKPKSWKAERDRAEGTHELCRGTACRRDSPAWPLESGSNDRVQSLAPGGTLWSKPSCWSLSQAEAPTPPPPHTPSQLLHFHSFPAPVLSKHTFKHVHG